MDSVGLRELKNRLSEYVDRVKSGEALVVTDRGHAVAEIRPIARKGRALTRRLSLADLVRTGLLEPGKPNHAKLYPLMPRVLQRRSSSRLLDEERGSQ